MNFPIRKIILLYSVIAIIICASLAYSHCQIPCGIYDDHARIEMITEHIKTIEKSCRQIQLLSEKLPVDHNQITRWVNNKEHHADELAQIITWYFMAQRIKPAPPQRPAEYKSYVNCLTLLHEMLIHTMKAKQSTELANIEKLKTLLTKFHEAYEKK